MPESPATHAERLREMAEAQRRYSDEHLASADRFELSAVSAKSSAQANYYANRADSYRSQQASLMDWADALEAGAKALEQLATRPLLSVEDREQALRLTDEAATLAVRAWRHDCSNTACAHCDRLRDERQQRLAEARRLLGLETQEEVGNG